MILTYFLPIGSMTYTYARVGLELWGSQSIGEATQRQLENIKSKRRVGITRIYVCVSLYIHNKISLTFGIKKKKKSSRA